MSDTTSYDTDRYDSGPTTAPDPVPSGGSGTATPLAADLELRWEESADSERWPRPAGRSKLLTGLALAVIAALAALVVVGALRIHHDDQLASARSSALAAGSRDAAAIATYSYSSFAAYAGRIESISTPKFAANFKNDSSSLRSVLSQYKAGSTGTVSGAGVGQVSATKATVYVFLNEKVSNSKQPGATERARMVVTLVRQGGRWLIANAVVE